MADWASVALAGVDIAMQHRQGQQMRKAQDAATAAEAQARTDALNREQADSATARDVRLKRLLAAQRAGAAGAGISGEGSAAAILAGLTAEDADLASRETARFDAARSDVLRVADTRRRLSLLDQQAATWNTVRRAGSLGTYIYRNRKPLFD
jgi:hypothetical protein